MFLTTSDVDEIAGPNGLEKLKEFLEKRINEYRYIDYKRQLSGEDKKEQNKEFLKDVTAFANANGGNIIIGALEPADGMSTEKQLIGIENGVLTAKRLETIAKSSIEPRISGLQIFPVAISENKYAIIVHIPQSRTKPHMVSYSALNLYTYWIRHTEGISHMTAHEVRESVLSSATAEGRVKEYLAERGKTTNLLVFHLNEKPRIFIQAMPLISLESSIDVLSNQINQVIRSGGEGHYQDHFGRNQFQTSNVIPTIDGVQWHIDAEKVNWQCELHRNGYLSVIFPLNGIHEAQNKTVYYVNKAVSNRITAFCDICDKILDAANIDFPYIVQCRIDQSFDTVLDIEESVFNEYSEPCKRSTLVWPALIRNTGESFLNTSVEIRRILVQAYGLNPNEVNY